MEKIRSFFLSKGGKTALVVSGVLTALICAVMNLVLIPRIESTTEGIRCFDMNFGYDFETAKRFLALLSQEGRDTYLHIQLPLDFVYPLVYTVFFVSLLTWLTKRVLPLSVLPLLLMGFDDAENIATIMMLRSAELSPALAAFGSAVTSVKTLLMYAVFFVIIVCILYRLMKRKQK